MKNLMSILINDKNYYKKRKDVCPSLFCCLIVKKDNKKERFIFAPLLKL